MKNFPSKYASKRTQMLIGLEFGQNRGAMEPSELALTSSDLVKGHSKNGLDPHSITSM